MHSLKTVHVHWEKSLEKGTYKIQSYNQRPVRLIKKTTKRCYMCCCDSPFSAVKFCTNTTIFTNIIVAPHGNVGNYKVNHINFLTKPIFWFSVNVDNDYYDIKIRHHFSLMPQFVYIANGFCNSRDFINIP